MRRICRRELIGSFLWRGAAAGAPFFLWIRGVGSSEIEPAFIEALSAAFAEGKEPVTLGVSMALDELVPLSRLMAEQVAELKKWAKGRARLATSQREEKTGRKIAA